MLQSEIISTRANIVRGRYALIPPEGLYANLLPEMPECTVIVLASRELGADFSEYLVKAENGKGTKRKFAAEEGLEAFLYVLEGEALVKCAEREYQAGPNSFVYAPPGVGLEFCSNGEQELKALIQVHRYFSIPDAGEPAPLFGNAYHDEDVILGGQGENPCRELIPHDLSYDWQMTVNIFGPGTHHGFIETHLQEHGLYCLEGTASYYLSDRWIPIQKDDFLWIGPYAPHGCYCLGEKRFVYLFSKVVNRTPVL